MRHVVRSTLLVLVLALVVGSSSGCAVKGISRVEETALTMPFLPVGLMPSWDVPRHGNIQEGPGPRRSSPVTEFFLGIPLFPLFLPSWEEPHDRSEGSGWWSQRAASPNR